MSSVCAVAAATAHILFEALWKVWLLIAKIEGAECEFFGSFVKVVIAFKTVKVYSIIRGV